MPLNLESGSTSAERRLNRDMNVVLGSLLGITILLLAASIAALVGFITANMRLKIKLKEFERSHSRYSIAIFNAKLEFNFDNTKIIVGIHDYAIIADR
jgi:hypothetical protein